VLAAIGGIAAFGGFLSGLLGIGGAVIMIPLLFYVPELLGVGSLGMKEVTGLSIVHVLAASISATIVHSRQRNVSRDLVVLAGSSMLAGSFLGGILSGYVPDRILLGVYAILATLAFGMLLSRPRREVAPQSGEALSFSRLLATVPLLALGLLMGLIGAGGGFMLMPYMVYVLGIPTRVAIGSALGVSLLSSLGGFAGKVAASQISLPPAIALVSGAVPGAYLGGLVSRRCAPRTLRAILAFVVLTVAVRVWYDLLG